MFIPQIPNVSLVAFYQKKPQKLTALIKKIQTNLAENQILKEKFIPYQLEQVHGTIIGCEGLKTEAGIVNKWFYEHQNQIKYMDLTNFIDYLLQNKHLPMIIRFAGYDRDRDYHFLSRSKHPFTRSFQLLPSGKETYIPILIGWPFQDNFIPKHIDDLRRDAQKFNLLHKYHSTPEAIDNDFYLRLGTIKGKLTSEEVNAIDVSWHCAIKTQVRNLLQAQSPINIRLDRDNLAFVKYQDLSLPLATTEILPITQATTSKIKKLY